jgi:DNA mismatch repair protein MLH3
MANHSHVLEKLDIPTRVRLRSTQILTSLPQIVSELVQNSLDASATRVEIGVDCEEWMCWVKDNGSGIPKDGLELLGRGSEEGRYGRFLMGILSRLAVLRHRSGTSKSHDLNASNSPTNFGFRGEGESYGVCLF